MDSKHKWTFNDFVIRIEELSNTPKRFCHVVFKTMLREFEYGIMDTEEYTIEVLKDVFFPDGTVFTTPFLEGLIKSLLPDNKPSVADEDKTKIRDDQIQQIVAKMQSQRKQPPPNPHLFEEILDKLKAFCRDDLKNDEALKKLEFMHDHDYLEMEWIIRILTCTVKSKLKCSTADMQTWFNEVINQPFNRVSSIIGQPHAPMLLLKTTIGIQDYNAKVLKYCGDSFYIETKYDGERFHVHKMKKSYKFFSRKGLDYSEKFGTTASKEFAAKIHPIFKEDVEHCVLDCEVLVWDRKHKRFVGKNDAASDYCIYDVKNLLESKDNDERALINRQVHPFTGIARPYSAQKALIPLKSTSINFNSSLSKQYSAKQNNVQKPNFSSSAPSNFYNDRISNQVFMIQQQQSQKKFQQLQQQRRLSSNFSSSNPAIPNNQRRQSFGGSFNTSQPLTAFCSNTPVSYPGYGQTLPNNYQFCTPIKNGMLSNSYIQSLPCAFTHGNLKFRA